jgi:hypothetical protein
MAKLSAETLTMTFQLLRHLADAIEIASATEGVFFVGEASPWRIDMERHPEPSVNWKNCKTLDNGSTNPMLQ